jgi:hypothetical protein
MLDHFGHDVEVCGRESAPDLENELKRAAWA